MTTVYLIALVTAVSPFQATRAENCTFKMKNHPFYVFTQKHAVIHKCNGERSRFFYVIRRKNITVVIRLVEYSIISIIKVLFLTH